MATNPSILFTKSKVLALATSLLLALAAIGPIAHATDGECSKLVAGVDETVYFLADQYAEGKRGGWISLEDPAFGAGGEWCGQVCGINLLQSMRLSVGLPLLANPVQAVNQVNSQNPEFIPGLTYRDAVRMLDLLIKEHMPRNSALASGLILNSPDLVQLQNMKATQDITIEDLNVTPTSGQILLMAINDTQGNRVGNHAFLLTGRSNNLIELRDPKFPQTPIVCRANVIRLHSPGSTSPRVTVNLTPLEPAKLPPQYHHNFLLVVMGVVTATLK